METILNKKLVQDIEKLAQYSPLAKQILELNLLKHCKQIDLVGYTSSVVKDINEFTFHPNGNCGCIELPDDYMFGIRCDHLMWSDGMCEGSEPFFKDEIPGPAILIYGNHKGFFNMTLVYLN